MNNQFCLCSKSAATETQTTASPSIDPEIKELIRDQNQQLKVLQQQVEQVCII